MRRVFHEGAELVQAELAKASVRPPVVIETRPLTATPAKPMRESVVDVVIDLVECPVRVTGPEVGPPTPQHGVEPQDEVLQVFPTVFANGHLLDPIADAALRFPGRPTLNEALARIALDAPSFAYVPAQEFKALPAIGEVHYLCLLRMKLQPQTVQDLANEDQP